MFNKAVGTAGYGLQRVGFAHSVVFGGANMTPRMRGLRTMFIIIFMFLLWNGSPFHVAGLFGWTMEALVAPLLDWSAGFAWWASAQQTLAGTNGIIALGGLIALELVTHVALRRVRWLGGGLKSLLALLVWAAVVGGVTGFPFGSLGDVIAVANIPFAIAALVWLFALSYLLAELIRLWKLALKDLDSDLGQILFRTITRTVLPEVIIVLGLFWASAKFDLSLGHSFAYQVIAWGWQIPLGYFIGVGMNWLIEQRERAGLMPTKEQRPEHLATALGDHDNNDTDSGISTEDLNTPNHHG